MRDEFRHSKQPTQNIGLSGHTEAKNVGNMNAALTKWLRERELGYQEVSFGYQNFKVRNQQQNTEQ